MKLVFATLTAVGLLAGVAASQPASAQGRCWWNGYEWVCRTPHHWSWSHHRHYRWHGWDWNRG